MPFPPLPTGRRIGFWVSDDDIYGADPEFGNAAGTVPTPQQFFNAYFLASPYPATMVWTGGLQSSASHAVPPAQEAQWFNQLLTICDAHPNVQIWAIFFINLSGFSVVGTTFSKTAGVTLKRAPTQGGYTTPYIELDIASTVGLSPNTTYQLVLQDINHNFIANVVQITTDATGAYTDLSGTTLTQNIAIPNVTAAQANQGCYLTIQGVPLATFQVGLGLTQDQTSDFQNYMNIIKGHPSFIGALFEHEYFGNTPSIVATFKSIVNGAGYYNLIGSGTANPANGDLVMRYSTYPYFGGALQTGVAPAGELGIHYGETGGPISPDPQPIWTQGVVQNIVANSEVAPITIIISVDDVNNPAGNTYLYMSPTLRGWIASTPAYSNFLLGNVVGPAPTTLTLVARQV